MANPVNDLSKVGSITFWMTFLHSDWATNDKGYKFPEKRSGPIVINASKEPDGTVRIEIDGPFNKTFQFMAQIPECGEKGLFVAITWEKKEVLLYLNGQHVETKKSA